MPIVTADLHNPAHQCAIVELLDMYSRDFMGDDQPLAQFTRDHLIDGLRQQVNALILLAYEEQRPVGLLIGFEGFSTFQAAPLLNIHDIAVTAEFRGKGIGRQLLRETAQIARNRGYSQISLEVRVDNSVAQQLYQSEGYKDCSPPMWFWKKQL